MWVNGENEREGEERKEGREIIAVQTLARECLGREEGGRCYLSSVLKELL